MILVLQIRKKLANKQISIYLFSDAFGPWEQRCQLFLESKYQQQRNNYRHGRQVSTLIVLQY